MAKVRTFRRLEASRYKVTLQIEEVGDVDTQLAVKYGDPEIDLGGEFTGPPLFELPASLKRLLSGGPFTASFDATDIVDAEDRADVWADEMLVRIQTAFTNLRANSDGFTEESVVTV